MNLPGKIVLALVIILGIIAATQISFSSDSKPEKKEADPPKSVAHIITHNESLGTFSVALKTAKLQDSLNSDKKFIVFTPSDSAFTDLPRGRFEDLMSDGHTDDVRSLVKHHLVSAAKQGSELKSGRLETLAGDSLIITHKNDTTFVNGAPIREKSIRASNGVIYIIDQVLMANTQN